MRAADPALHSPSGAAGVVPAETAGLPRPDPGFRCEDFGLLLAPSGSPCRWAATAGSSVRRERRASRAFAPRGIRENLGDGPRGAWQVRPAARPPEPRLAHPASFGALVLLRGAHRPAAPVFLNQLELVVGQGNSAVQQRLLVVDVLVP